MKEQTSKRREFLRVIGGVGVASLTVPNYLMGAKPSSSLSRSGVLPVSYTHLTLPTILRV